MNRRYLPPTDFAFGVQVSPASFLSFPRAAWECITGRASERDGGCTPVPTVFDNHCHIFIRQTFRTGLQTPSSHRKKLPVLRASSQAPAWEFSTGSSSFPARKAGALLTGFPSGSLGTSVSLNLMAVTQSAGTRPQ